MQNLHIKNVIRAAEGEFTRWAARFWVDQRIGVTVDGGGLDPSPEAGPVTGGRAVREDFGVSLGDEGSGLWISMKAIIAVIQAYDGRLEDTRLTQPVLDHFGAPSIQALSLREPGGFISKAKMIEAVETQEHTRFIADLGVVLEKTSTGESPSGTHVEDLLAVDCSSKR